MKKNNKKRIDPIIVIIIAFVVIIIVAVISRNNSYTQTWLVCDKDITNEYNEIMKFKFDNDGKLYGFYREELLHNLTEETLQTNMDYFQEQIDKMSDNFSDNFQYYMEKNDNNLVVKTYIGVSVFPAFFDSYMDSDTIKSSSSIDEIKNTMNEREYNCSVNRK